jgi:lipoic acid synthetase
LVEDAITAGPATVASPYKRDDARASRTGLTPLIPTTTFGLVSTAPPSFAPKPPWLKVRAPGGAAYNRLKETLRSLDLHTVCEEARCPNVGECWAEGTATIMLLGDVCTRGCRFCAVTTGDPRGAVDGREPEHVARAIARLGLQYVVLTMVDRDDLLDGGAAHVASTVRRLHELRPDILVETLLGDFGGHMDYVDTTAEAKPDVWAHNIEVVRRLQRTIRDARCGYDLSLAVLARVKEKNPSMATKSSVMVGIGETDDEVFETLADLRAAGVDVATVGQYLRPSPKHAPVARYVAPETFARFADEGQRLGFAYVASGPLVRSSYKAAEHFIRGVLRPGDLGGADRLMKERLAEAQAAAARADESGLRSTTKLAARAGTELVSVERLVRKG